MPKYFPIYLADLLPIVQAKVLEHYNISTPAEGNLDMSPLFTLGIPREQQLEFPFLTKSKKGNND